MMLAPKFQQDKGRKGAVRHGNWSERRYTLACWGGAGELHKSASSATSQMIDCCYYRTYVDIGALAADPLHTELRTSLQLQVTDTDAGCSIRSRRSGGRSRSGLQLHARLRVPAQGDGNNGREPQALLRIVSQSFTKQG